MTSSIKILAVDDDKISQKMIGRALQEDVYTLEYADNGKQGLTKALAILPDLIILDVEMPQMNGYEVCEQLRNNEDTQHTPVIFLSSHSSLRERMQGYEAGADDYLVKPFENENLAAKVKILARYQEEQNRLRSKFEQAQKTAMIALTGTSELGLAIQFVEKSYGYHNYHDLANALLNTLGQLDLHCAVMILEGEAESWFSNDGAVKPLEKEMLEMVDRNQRFVDFGSRTIINFYNLSLLVKNMPLDDMDRYGRLKDLLPMLLASVDAKINAIRADQALSTQSAEVMQAFTDIKTRLYYLALRLIDKQKDSQAQLNNMVTELNTDLLRMGLDDDQESYVLGLIDNTIEEAIKELDASSILYQTFSGVFVGLKKVSARQQELQETFARMNEFQVSEDEVDDGSIEFF